MGLSWPCKVQQQRQSGCLPVFYLTINFKTTTKSLIKFSTIQLLFWPDEWANFFVCFSFLISKKAYVHNTHHLFDWMILVTLSRYILNCIVSIWQTGMNVWVYETFFICFIWCENAIFISFCLCLYAVINFNKQVSPFLDHLRWKKKKICASSRVMEGPIA